MILARPAWRSIGVALTLTALAFVGWRFSETDVMNNPAWSDPRLWLRTATAGVLYGASLLAVALGWWLIVRGSGAGALLPLGTGLRLYGISQLFKYLPSNMLHYVGRHAMLNRLGISHSAAALGAFGELALLLAAALLVAAAAAPAALVIPGSAVAILLGAALLVLFGLAAIRPTLLAESLSRLGGIAATLQGRGLRVSAAASFACYILFFLASGAVFTFLASSVGPWNGSHALLLVSIWAGCWALGFVTPGAPAGLGVREALLIAALTAAGGGDGAGVVAVAMRIATMVGDIVLAAAGALAGLASASGPKTGDLRSTAAPQFE